MKKLRKQQKAIFIDSNIFFYSIINDKKYGETCSNIIKSIYNEEIDAAISQLILLEVANALRKYQIGDISNRLRAIISLPLRIIDLDRMDVIEGIYLSEVYGISPYDATHVVSMRKSGIRLILSADKDFDRVPGIDRIDPLSFKI